MATPSVPVQEARNIFQSKASPNSCQAIVPIKLPIELKPDWNYSFVLTPLAFGSPDGYPLVSYTVAFKTKP